MKAEVIVIGGGAAGLMAAGTAAERGKDVLLLERMERTGTKLLITGKGRCNVTNNCSVTQVLQNIPRNPRFLQSALHAFGPEDVMAFFEAQGVELKTERGNRVFPASDHALDIVEALRRWTKAAGVKLRRGCAAQILTDNGVVTGVRSQEGTVYEADAAILATGGKSYPRTGSDGSGYALAAALGHTIVPPEGSLVPLQEAGDWCQKLQGLSLRNVGVKLLNQAGKAVYTDFGELLFTHFGLSGPTVLSASAHMVPGERYTLEIDLKPALDDQTLDRRILRDFEAGKNKSLDNLLGALYPRSLVPVMLARAELDGTLQANAVTRVQRRRLLELTRRFPIAIAGKRPVEEAIVTSGGVDVEQVQPKTMASRLVSGLYLAGEVLDVDAYTGGFNLQIAWSTGRAAGLHV